MLEGAGTHEGEAWCTMSRGGSCVGERGDETNVVLVVLAAVFAVVVREEGLLVLQEKADI
jgi:hypothetical protein